MPGKEIKGRSKIANYRHGGRIGYAEGPPGKTYPSTEWKKPKKFGVPKDLTREGAEDLLKQIKDRPKKLKFRC